MPPTVRVIAYVDGFNLYYGIRECGLRHLWLDISALANSLLRPSQTLVAAKYFTAMISGAKRTDPPGKAAEKNAKRKRQSDYVEALRTTGVMIYPGHYIEKRRSCRKCGDTWLVPEEKMTDVQIATHMLTDAFADRFDVALVVSADSDLVPPVKVVRYDFNKRVVACLPPGRKSYNLSKAAGYDVQIEEAHLTASQFPDPVTKPDGYEIRRPIGWS